MPLLHNNGAGLALALARTVITPLMAYRYDGVKYCCAVQYGSLGCRSSDKSNTVQFGKPTRSQGCDRLVSNACPCLLKYPPVLCRYVLYSR